MTVRQTFWSRRKQAVEAEARQESEARVAAREAETLAAQEQKSDPDLLEELGLPDPDTLKAGDDFSVFMAKSVPARLRNRALRKLWLSNPALANLDGLVDYAEDYKTAGLTGEAVQTAYQVGKGLLKHVEELARQPGSDAHSAADSTQMAEASDTSETVLDQPDAADAEPADTEEEPRMAAAAPRRRMRFAVEANG